VSKAIEVEGSGLQACPGFRASAFNYTSGLAIVLDNINKFISNKSCLERIHEIMDDPNIRDKVSRIQLEFQFKTVIGGYGHKKTYIVEDIDFKKNPVTMRFESHDGKKMSIAEYFLKTYDMKVTDMKQPLFIVKINGKECHIPPEFCTIDGVPQTIREDPRRMRDVLASCRKNPA
jgi:ABC-type multidrug transport system fused ATPase/permease subunit